MSAEKPFDFDAELKRVLGRAGGKYLSKDELKALKRALRDTDDPAPSKSSEEEKGATPARQESVSAVRDEEGIQTRLARMERILDDPETWKQWGFGAVSQISQGVRRVVGRSQELWKQEIARRKTEREARMEAEQREAAAREAEEQSRIETERRVAAEREKEEQRFQAEHFLCPGCEKKWLPHDAKFCEDCGRPFQDLIALNEWRHQQRVQELLKAIANNVHGVEIEVEKRLREIERPLHKLRSIANSLWWLALPIVLGFLGVGVFILITFLKRP